MNEDSTKNSTSRRSFIKTSAVVGAGLGLSNLAPQPASAQPSYRPRPGKHGSMIEVPFEAHGDEVRVGLVGVGHRGFGMIDEFLGVPGVRITAIADTFGPRAHSAAAKVVAAGHPAPAVYTGGAPSYDEDAHAAYAAAVTASKRARGVDPDPRADDYTGLCARDDVDIVYTATPWEWHHPVAMAAMHAGKHVAVECPMAMTMDHLWELVDTCEATRRHCLQLENNTYDSDPLRIMNMAHAGLFGELVSGACGYLHDLRYEMFLRSNRDSTFTGTPYRRLWNTRLDAAFYPTHGIGLMAMYMDINRGDRFTTLTAKASYPARGLYAYRERYVPKSDPSWNEEYIKGDKTQCLIETAQGRLVRLEHDTTTTYPGNAEINTLSGTSGRYEDEEVYPIDPSVFIDPDKPEREDSWDNWGDYAEYDHWLVKKFGDGGSHGGSDYRAIWHLVQAMRLGLAPAIDVYDSATWSAPVPLSADSLAHGGREVKFPDFTRGNWEAYHKGLDSPNPEE